LRDQPFVDKQEVRPIDNQYFERILAVVRKFDDPYLKVLNIVEEYKRVPSTPLSTDFLAQFLGIESIFLEGQMYATLAKKNEKAKETAKEENNKGLALAKAEKYEQAIIHFKESLAHAQLCLTSQDVELSSYYFNCGRTLQRLGQLAQAIPYLEISVNLREKGQQADQLARAKSVLNEVKQQLQQNEK
jgi:tetratricopeptide (TPR) repeat protein